MACSIVLTFAGSALAMTFTSGAYFKIINKASGKCLDNMGVTTDGADACQWGNGSSYNQQWQITDAGSGYYKIICRTGGKCLDSIGRTSAGSNVGQWASGTSTNQQWQIVDDSAGYVKIINRANGMCLDTGGQTADGNIMKMYGSGNSDNQKWRIVQLGSTQTLDTTAKNWYDSNNNPIRASGGDFLKVGSTYYWYGCDLDKTAGNRGINCYSSTDLVHWTFKNKVIKQAASGDLDYNHFVGRPKVVYNPTTKKYVMHVNWTTLNVTPKPHDQLGTATCDTPDGDFTWNGYQMVNGYRIGDRSIFQDTDGKVYLVTVSDQDGINSDINIMALSSDYLTPTTIVKQFKNEKREAPYILKRGSTYYLFTSGLDGWNSTATYYRTATSLSGTWSNLTLLATSPNSTNSFDSQTNVILTVQGTTNTSYIYVGDLWGVPTGHNGGVTKAVWCPMTFNANGVPTITQYNNITINTETGVVSQ